MDRLIIAAAVVGLIIALILVFVALRGGFGRRRHGYDDRSPRKGQSARPESAAVAITAGFMGRVAIAYVAILIAIGGAGLLGYQAVAWFESGHWPAPSLADTARHFSGGSWPVPGGSGVLDWIPLGIVLLVGALLCLAIVFRDPPNLESV